MSKLFSIDVKIYGTAYIQADTAEEALEKIKAFNHTGIQFSDRRQDIGEFADRELIMTGECYSPDMPEISLSPVMTIHGPDEDAVAELALDFADVD